MDPLPLGGTTSPPTVAYWRKLLGKKADWLTYAGRGRIDFPLPAVAETFKDFVMWRQLRRKICLVD